LLQATGCFGQGLKFVAIQSVTLEPRKPQSAIDQLHRTKDYIDDKSTLTGRQGRERQNLQQRLLSSGIVTMWLIGLLVLKTAIEYWVKFIYMLITKWCDKKQQQKPYWP